MNIETRLNRCVRIKNSIEAELKFLKGIMNDANIVLKSLEKNDRIMSRLVKELQQEAQEK